MSDEKTNRRSDLARESFERVMAEIGRLIVKDGLHLSPMEHQRVDEAVHDINNAEDEADSTASFSALVILCHDLKERSRQQAVSAQNKINAGKRRNPRKDMHAEIQRIGRGLAKKHTDRAITGMVRDRMSSPPSEKTIRNSLRRAGIIG